MSDIVQRLKDSRSSMNSIMLTEAADEITRLRKALSEAEQREKDARREVLEDAARYHEYRADNHAAAHKHVVSDFHEMIEKTHRNAADDIRSLQSEER